MSESRVLVGLQNKAVFCLKLEGDVRVPWCVSLETYCGYVIQQPDLHGVCVDLTAAINLDSTTLGVLAKVAILCSQYCEQKAVLLCADEDLIRLSQSMGFDAVFDIKDGPALTGVEFDALPYVDCSESEFQESVISAHRTLMDMNEDNKAAFNDLVTALESPH